MTDKIRIEKLLNEFAKISGNSVVEGLVKKSAEESNIKIKLEDLKIKNDLSSAECMKLYGHIIIVFSRIYGANLLEGIMKKVEK